MRKLALNDEILLKIEKPARYIGNEVNSVMKDPKKVDIRFAMCFPDGYGIYPGNVLRPWRTDRKSNGTELEDEQPHQRRHGYLRRFRDRGNRAGHRGNRYGHCLWPLRNVFI